MSGRWWDGRMVGFDLETTSPDPEEARIVTAALVMCGGGAATDVRTWLADPGIEIPEEATSIHGVTTAQAREAGTPAGVVVCELVQALEAEVKAGRPLVIFNARFDMTVLDRETRRHTRMAPLVDRCDPLVVDPAVIDKFLDRFRRSYPYGETAESAKAKGIASSRTLGGMVDVYGVRLDGAHDAAWDALAACRIAWAMGKYGRVVRRIRHARDEAELNELMGVWERVQNDLAALHEQQREWALEERARFAEYRRSKGDAEWERIANEIGWPTLELREVQR